MAQVSPSQRFTRERPCPICRGYERMPRGEQTRCTGYLSADGKVAHCTRDEHRGQLDLHRGSGGGETYAHWLEGDCRCGVSHGAPRLSVVRSKFSPIVALYDYTDAQGKLAYQVVRTQDKQFMQRRPDGRGDWIWNIQGVPPLLYKLPEVRAAVAAGDPIWIAEGEKDVNALGEAGLVATCNSGGAGKFSAIQANHLRGADVVIVQDKDEAGRKHALDVVAKIGLRARTIKIVEAARGKDAADHLGAGLGIADFVHVWPKGDPLVERKRIVLAGSFIDDDPLERVDIAEQLRRPQMPQWPSTLKHLEADEFGYFEGVTIVAGGPGAGKSFLAIASSIEAAKDGWEVFYLSSEMDPAIPARRAFNRDGVLPPADWHLLNVKYGASAESIVRMLSESVTAKDTLVVFDSVSSFIDQAKTADRRDAHGIGALKDLLIWCINVRRASEGRISFLVLSELNKEGRTKGLFGDHKADRVLSMRSSQVRNLDKEIEITKGWNSQVGISGSYTLHPMRTKFTRAEESHDQSRANQRANGSSVEPDHRSRRFDVD